jgi:succinoglycan biosynthesis transport protein ExoP
MVDKSGTRLVSQGESSSIGVTGRSLNPIASLKSHKVLALGIALIFLGVGFPIAWLKGGHTYQATAVIHVSPRFMKNLEEDKELEFQSNSQYRQFVQHQVYTIGRYDIVLEALESLGDRRNLWQRPGESSRYATERLQGALKIRPIPESYLITIRLEGTEPEGLEELVNAISETYLEKAKKEEFFGNDDRIAQLQQEREALEEQINQKGQERNELTREFGTTNFNEGLINPYDVLLLNSREALASAQRHRIEAEAELDAVDSNKRKEGSAALTATAQEFVDKDPGLTSLKASFNKRQSELLTKLNALSIDHPGRNIIKKEFASLERAVQLRTTRLVKSNRQRYLAKRKVEVYRAKQIEEELLTQVSELHSQASSYAAIYQEGLKLKRELQHLHERLEAVQSRMSFLLLEVDAPGFLRLVTAALPPEVPFKGGRKKYALLVLIAACGIAFLVPTAVDFLDPRVKGLRELEGVLGFLPVGWLPDMTEKEGRIMAPDRLQRLALTLENERCSRGTRIAVFSSVSPGGGTSTVVLDLVHELEKMGTKAIAVEANIQKADSRYIKKGNAYGLLNVGRENVNLQDAILPPSNGLPTRMPIGSLPDGSRLADGGKVEPTLQALKEHFDLILIDGPSLTHSSDGEYVCALADGVFLIVEHGTVPAEKIREAARVLERISPLVVGAVLNRLPAPRPQRSLNDWVNLIESGGWWSFGNGLLQTMRKL